ncbi:uncharacterized protein LOC128547230 [Mercenaria mercenaria]|uniref:uncharacterized protein LOC128547230 n=1 Tax=Mercenaria mercenaria TaxID=6596 RepID=UPI00234F22B7|nr:uncharacterized protein LOC128547230 [Mercenaria mercenaria]
MYSKVKSCIRGCKTYSDFFECSLGLKQGEVISPVLFSLFLEDIELSLIDGVDNGFNLDEFTFILLLFADDMVIIGKNPEDLQNRLNLLKEYCVNWGLQVNPDKSKIVVFRKRGPVRRNEVWYYDNKTLGVVDSYNYLGTVFNYTGTFLSNQETIAGKGLKAMNVLLNNISKLSLKPSTILQLFDSFVTSTLCYASEIWGFGKSKPIERIHMKFCKLLLHVKTSTCNYGIYSELGRYPLYVNRYVRIIKYWLKVVKSDNIFIQSLYYSLVSDIEMGRTNWASNVKHLLDSYGFSYVWINPDIVDLNTFHIVFKNRVIENFVQNCYNGINNSRCLCSYKLFKTTFGFENYLDFLSPKLRIAFSRLRRSSHQLRIESGRYGANRVEHNQRYCLLCNSGDIEDEYHFIIKCPVYDTIRKLYIKPYYYRRPSVYKFTQLMHNTQRSALLKLSKFIYNAFILRKGLSVAIQ